MDYYALGQRIRARRKAKGLSQEGLAERVGISTTHMSHIETGNTKLGLTVLVDLAAALEVAVDDLLREERAGEGKAGVERLLRALEGCSEEELRVIEAVVKAVKGAMGERG